MTFLALKNGEIMYKYQSEAEGLKMNDFDEDERIIYSIIEQSGNIGIPNFEIKKLMKLQGLDESILTRVLKSLGKKH